MINESQSYLYRYLLIFHFNSIGDHKQGAGGSFGEKSMMLHLDYAKRIEESGLIEELFMHEGAHVSLDGYHQKVLQNYCIIFQRSF